MILVILFSFLFLYSFSQTEVELIINGNPTIDEINTVLLLPHQEVEITVNRINGKLVYEDEVELILNSKNGTIVSKSNQTKVYIPPKKQGVYQIEAEIHWKDEKIIRKIVAIRMIPIEKSKKSEYLTLIKKYTKKQISKNKKKINKEEIDISFLPSTSYGLKHLRYYAHTLPLGISKSKLTPINNHLELYLEKIPKGIIEITKSNEDVYISSHFRLKDFVCKGDKKYPKYICLSMDLVKKLEAIIEEANKEGYKCSKLTIISGYRTPWYNRKLGNVKYSRHIYGDAADIIIDENNDGIMDDINHDGRIDVVDSEILANIVENVELKDGIVPGGIGVYSWNKKKRHFHGPFVHVDTRGYSVRW